jgi:hypothetical protein
VHLTLRGNSSSKEGLGSSAWLPTGTTYMVGETGQCSVSTPVTLTLTTFHKPRTPAKQQVHLECKDLKCMDLSPILTLGCSHCLQVNGRDHSLGFQLVALKSAS